MNIQTTQYCFDNKTNKIISINEAKKEDSKKLNYECLKCRFNVCFVQSNILNNHFRHYKKNSICDFYETTTTPTEENQKMIFTSLFNEYNKTTKTIKIIKKCSCCDKLIDKIFENNKNINQYSLPYAYLLKRISKASTKNEILKIIVKTAFCSKCQILKTTTQKPTPEPTQKPNKICCPSCGSSVLGINKNKNKVCLLCVCIF